MFNQYESNVNSIIIFLKLLKIKVSNSTVNETLRNHPDWPSLLCVSDSLSKWHISNAAGRITIDDIDKLPTPFIAYTWRNETPLTIVSCITKTDITYYSKNLHKPITQTKEDFLKKWDGIYLIAETDERSGEKDYRKNRKTSLINSIRLFFLILGLVGFFCYKFSSNIHNTNMSKGIFWGGYVEFLLSLAGIIITSLLLWYEIDKNNPVLHRVCTGILRGDCNAILTSKQAKVFSWLSWSEVGFFYFAGSLLALLFSSMEIIKSIYILSWLGLLALPYTVFSVYYQWRVVRQWCILCLSVQVLLIAGATNTLSNHLLQPISFSLSLVLKGFLLFAIPAFLWFCAKPYILKLQQAQNTHREYQRIKFNGEIFDILLKKQKAVNIAPENLGVDIGNRSARNSLIKVCNPYCGPCSKTHEKIEGLLKANDNLHVKIIYTAPNKEKNLMFNPVRHFLAIAAEKNDEKTKSILNDWYLTDKKEYESFAQRHPMNEKLTDQGNNIETMNNWCNKMEISRTPTFFFNGYQLPEAYSIEDLQYFLLE